MKKRIIIIAHNIRSAYNIGALFRTSDGFGVSEILLSGYSPAPADKESLYKSKAQKMLEKTAIGAEEYVPWKQIPSFEEALAYVREKGCSVVALEQDERSISYVDERLKNLECIAIVLGNEIDGVEPSFLDQCDYIAEIPMLGKKHSLNVSVAHGVFLSSIIS